MSKEGLDDLLLLLGRLRSLLAEEKDLLTANEGARLPDLVKEKLALMSELASFSDILSSASLSEEEKGAYNALVSDIKGLQTTNVMLTKQSLLYTETLLSAFAGGTSSQPSAYDSKGQSQDKDKGEPPSIIDRSV